MTEESFHDQARETLVWLLERLPRDTRHWFVLAAFLEAHVDVLSPEHRARVYAALDAPAPLP